MEYQHYQSTMNIIEVLDMMVEHTTAQFIQSLKEYAQEREKALDTLTIAQRVHERHKRSSQ